MPGYSVAKMHAGGLAPPLWRNIFLWLLVCGFAWLMLAAPAFAQQQPIPELQQRITDTTGTLNAETQSRLTQALADLEQRRGAQIAVLMVPSTGQEDIALYAVRAFEQWKLGREAVDDGILFLIAKDDRSLRIEVGYGLEGAVPDLLAGRIIREQVVPRFQQGDFAGGVEAGVNSLIGLVDGEDLPPVQNTEDSSDEDDIIGAVFLLVVLATVLPPLISVAGTALFSYLLFNSVVVAVLAALAALLLSFVARSWVRHGGGGGASGGGGITGTGGFGGGGSSGGGFGGGGGSSGGGGASGRW